MAHGCAFGIMAAAAKYQRRWRNSQATKAWRKYGINET